MKMDIKVGMILQISISFHDTSLSFLMLHVCGIMIIIFYVGIYLVMGKRTENSYFLLEKRDEVDT
jgi:uncharacterized membrane protein